MTLDVAGEKLCEAAAASRLSSDTVWSHQGLPRSHLFDFARQHRRQFDPQLLGVFEGGREATQVGQRLNPHQTRSLFICRLGGKQLMLSLKT